MPYKIKKNRSGKFMVINSKTKRVHSKGTTKKKAIKQMRLLYALENPNFVLRNTKNTRKRKIKGG